MTDDRQAQFYDILERLLRQMMLKKRQEERYKRVDEAIRRHQQSRKEAAATVEASDRKKKNGRKYLRLLRGWIDCQLKNGDVLISLLTPCFFF